MALIRRISRCSFNLPIKLLFHIPAVSISSQQFHVKRLSSDSKLRDRKFKRLRGTGDQGTSALFTGERRSKDDIVFEALGSIDELSCSIGVVVAMLYEKGFFDITQRLTDIQCSLQDLATHLATPQTSAKEAFLKRSEFDKNLPELLDTLIDDYAEKIPPLDRFILPGGGIISAYIHVARSSCRHAERRCIPLFKATDMDPIALKYLNRLSDFLFVLARYVCYQLKMEEVQYKKPKA